MALFQALQELQSAEEDLQVWLQQRKPCSFMCSAASLTEEDLSKQTSAAALKGWFDTTVHFHQKIPNVFPHIRLLWFLCISSEKM